MKVAPQLLHLADSTRSGAFELKNEDGRRNIDNLSQKYATNKRSAEFSLVALA